MVSYLSIYDVGLGNLRVDLLLNEDEVKIIEVLAKYVMPWIYIR
jgi:hypothetical protein